jgi:hypothetical protein
VVDATEPAPAFASDRALPLRATTPIARGLGGREGAGGGRAFVRVHARVVGPLGSGEWTQALLTPQAGAEGGLAGPEGAGGPGVVHERLIDPESLVPSAWREAGADRAGVLGEGARVEYWFETRDDRTPRRSVRLVDPPAVTGAGVEVTLPGYAGQAEGVFVRGRQGVRASGAETVGPVLAGSLVRVEVTLNKPVPVEGAAGWLGEVGGGAVGELGGPDAGVLADARVEPVGVEGGMARAFVLTGRAERSGGIAGEPVDEHGIRARSMLAIGLEVTPDAVPAAAVVTPERDEALPASARVGLVGEAADDLGLTRAALAVARPLGGSAAEAGAATGDAASWRTVAELFPGAPTSTTLRVEHELALADLGVVAGDEVVIAVEASDGFVDASGAGRSATRSGVRVIRVIGDEEYVDRVRRDLAGVRTGALRVEQDQARVGAPDPDQAPGERMLAEQRGVTRGVRELAGQIGRVRSGLARSGVRDETLEALAAEAEQLLEEAEGASDAAQDALARDAARDADDPRGPRDEEARAEAQRRQSGVRAALTELADRLGSGQESLIARRTLERLIADQERVREQTERAGEKTVGRSPAELNQEELSELERIAARQREVAQAARAAVDDLERRAEQAERGEEGSGAAMATAAQSARQGDTENRLRRAAEQIAQNQTGAAGQEQDAALDALRRALDDIKESQRRRDDQLRRQLAQLAQMLELLVRHQARERARLDEPGAGQRARELAEAMMGLQARTLAARDEAARAFREVVRLAQLVEQASAAQGRAVAALRAEAPDIEAGLDEAGLDEAGLDEARAREDEALEALTAALDDARKAAENAEQRERDRVRAELRQAYEELAGVQDLVREETAGLIGRELSRRERASARALGTRQEEIGLGLRALMEKTQGLSEARAFGLAHAQAGGLIDRAAGELARGAAGAGVGRDQARAAGVLRSLAQALAEDQGQDPGFQQDAGGGGGGGGGGQGGGPQPAVPPVAELKLLRSLQQAALELTRAAGESADGAGLVGEAAELQGQIAETARGLLQDLAGSAASPVRDGAPSDTGDQTDGDGGGEQP